MRLIQIQNSDIQRAKEKLGERNAEIIANLLQIENWNPQRRMGSCPNPQHHDRNPSCSYNPKTYSFKCFACGYTCDIIDAYITGTGCTFLEACEKLFEEADIPYSFAEKGARERAYKYPKPQYADNKNKVYEYWGKRMISPKTIDYLGIQQDKQGNTLFQYYDLNDVLVMCKVRKSEVVPHGERKIWHLENSDHKNILYNINKINTTQPLIICTGEGDCAALVECGFLNTVSINGGDQNTQWITECWDFLQNFNEIILVHDNDKSGEDYIKNVTPRLGEYRVKIAEIPFIHTRDDGEKVRIKDVNELLFYQGKDAVRDVINSAKESEIPAIVDYTEVKRFDMSDVDGFVTGFEDLDAALGKNYMGSTTLITGIASAGKSSFISTLVCRSIEQGFPCFIYSGELSNPSLKNWIDFVHAGQRGIEEVQGERGVYYKIQTPIYKQINEYYRGQLYFYKDSFSHKTDDLLATAESVVRRLGVKTIVFDNLTSVDLSCDDNSKWSKQEDFIRQIIDFSKRWNVACFVVIHPKKMEQVRKMSIFDLQGVAAAANLAQRVISLYRVSPKDKKGIIGRNGKYIQPPMKGSVILEILKDRYGSANNKEFVLYYDVPSKRFYTTPKNLAHAYGWEKDSCGETEYLPYGTPALDEDCDEEVFG